MYLIS